MENDVFATMKILSKTISDNLQPFLEIQRKLAEASRPLQALSKSVMETADPVVEIFRQIEAINRVIKLSTIPEPSQTSLEPALQTTNPITEMFRRIEVFQRVISDVTEKLPEGTQRALALLGQRGWYISLKMPMSALYKLAKEVQLGNYSKVDEWMNAFYENNLDWIKQSLQKQFPHRSPILECTFQAHKGKEYELSVPVFLSQADGICHELIRIHGWNIQLYSKKGGRPGTADFVEQLVIHPLCAALMEPLRIPMPIGASAHDRERQDYPAESLNRHQILHGEAIDYATQTNSCKAISLLHYVATILNRDFLEQEDVSEKTQ